MPGLRLPGQLAAGDRAVGSTPNPDNVPTRPVWTARKRPVSAVRRGEVTAGHIRRGDMTDNYCCDAAGMATSRRDYTAMHYQTVAYRAQRQSHAQ